MVLDADAMLEAYELEQDRANALADLFAATNLDPVLSPGVFIRGEDVFKVVLGRESSKMYAKRLVDDKFEYASGAFALLRESDRMTLDAAMAIGRVTGVCVFCSLTLTDPVSIAEGVGPTCEARYFGAKSRSMRKAAARKAAKAAAAATVDAAASEGTE